MKHVPEYYWAQQGSVRKVQQKPLKRVVMACG
jgi:hypothetical protein